MTTAKYDGIVFEMEHNPWDIRALRDSLQYMLNRAPDRASPARSRPPSRRWCAFRRTASRRRSCRPSRRSISACYGIVWPHISTVDEAYNAVAACRYPRLKTAPLYEPAGVRGDGPTRAVRYWGLSQQEYYDRADVWPLNPKGEIFVILMMEDTRGIENLADI